MKPDIAALKARVADAEARYRRGRAHGTPRQINLRAIVAKEVALCCRTLAPEHIREAMQMRRDLGFDDLDMVGLALGLEAAVDLHRRLDLTECATVADVVGALARALGSTKDMEA
jgi:hypothetical protein